MHGTIVTARNLVAALLSAGSLMISAAPASATSIQFSGSTLGCFTSGCTPVTGAPVSGNLTFSTTSFNGVLVEDDGIDNENIVLGTFVIPPEPLRGNANVTPNDTFVLQVAFSLPSSGGPIYTAEVNGSITPSANNTQVQVVFLDDPIQVFFPGGSFFLSVVNDPLLSRNPQALEVALTGRIHNVSSGGTAPVSPVPEPASLVLLGTGLIAAATGARRRTQK